MHLRHRPLLMMLVLVLVLVLLVQKHVPLPARLAGQPIVAR